MKEKIMKNRYTPGPWKWQYWQTDGDIVYNVIPVMRPLDGQIENVADAQLIAAAPELLQVCEAVLSALNSHQAYDKDMRPELRAVIAKAIGR